MNQFIRQFFRNWFSSNRTVLEKQICETINLKYPEASVKVNDISGGHGAIYEVKVRCKDFEGLTLLKQHKIVTELIKDQIKTMHGVRIFTSVPGQKNENINNSSTTNTNTNNGINSQNLETTATNTELPKRKETET